MKRRLMTAMGVAVLLATVMVGHEVLTNPSVAFPCTDYWSIECWIFGF